VSVTSSLLVGSETQTYRRQRFTTGIQRVIREAHEGLADYLGAAGASISWVRTDDEIPSDTYRTNPYLASDPVVGSAEAPLADIDTLLILDIGLGINFGAIIHRKSIRPLRVITLIHDIMPITHPQWFPGDDRSHFRRYLQKVLHVSDEIIVPTAWVKGEIESLGWRTTATIHVIHLGSTFPASQPKIRPPHQLSLLYVSTVEPRKGHQQLMGAFNILRQAEHDVSLTLVGRRGWGGHELYAGIEQHPDFGGRLKWLQGIDDNQLLSLASSSTLGVFPSEAEGFGLFIEEALSCGLDVVASDIPPFVERRQAGLWLSTLDPHSLADSILSAHAAPRSATRQKPVRTMRDFAYDVSQLTLTAERSHPR